MRLQSLDGELFTMFTKMCICTISLEVAWGGLNYNQFLKIDISKCQWPMQGSGWFFKFERLLFFLVNVTVHASGRWCSGFVCISWFAYKYPGHWTGGNWNLEDSGSIWRSRTYFMRPRWSLASMNGTPQHLSIYTVTDVGTSKFCRQVEVSCIFVHSQWLIIRDLMLQLQWRKTCRCSSQQWRSTCVFRKCRVVILPLVVGIIIGASMESQCFAFSLMHACMYYMGHGQTLFLTYVSFRKW